jgi:hypothetical protein
MHFEFGGVVSAYAQKVTSTGSVAGGWPAQSLL